MESHSKLLDYGGYDNEFVDNVPDRLVCNAVCTKVLRDPHLTSCCGHHFCASCLESWFDKYRSQSCPHCRAKGRHFSHFLDKKLNRDISELKVRCSNKDKGCRWTGELQSLKKHLTSDDGCGYVQVDCPNSKDDLVQLCLSPSCRDILRKDLSGHVRYACEFRIVPCKYCGKLDKYTEITGSHLKTCAKYPLDCPNKCGKKDIPREDMPAHREKCPLEPVTCPFAEAGCGAKLIRRELHKHLTDNQQAHSLKLLTDYKKVKKAVEQFETTKMALAIQSSRLESMQFAISRDVKELCEASREDYRHILKSIETNLGLVKKSIEGRGFEHGITFTIPSKEFFEYSIHWYSPSFSIMGFPACLQAELGPQESLSWSLVCLEACTVEGLCQNRLYVQMANSTRSYDIWIKLPCIEKVDESRRFSTILPSKKGTIEPATKPILLTVYLSTEVVFCRHCSSL